MQKKQVTLVITSTNSTTRQMAFLGNRYRARLVHDAEHCPAPRSGVGTAWNRSCVDWYIACAQSRVLELIRGCHQQQEAISPSREEERLFFSSEFPVSEEKRPARKHGV